MSDITTVSFVSAFRKPKNASGRVIMGPKHNLVQFKSLLGCLFIPSHLVFHFTLVNWFRFGWQDWWGHSGISLLNNIIAKKVNHGVLTNHRLRSFWNFLQWFLQIKRGWVALHAAPGPFGSSSLIGPTGDANEASLAVSWPRYRRQKFFNQLFDLK